MLCLGRGGGQVVSVLAFYSDDPSSNPAEAKKRKIELICDRTSQLSFKIKNGWLKYDIRVMYKKYTTPLPIVGCGVVEIHLEMAQPTNKKDRAL